MIEFVAWGAGLYILSLVTWFLYLALMNVKPVRRELHPVAKFNAYILLIIFIPLDVLVNILIGSILFLEPPRIFRGAYFVADGEWLLTARLKRHKAGSGWRSRLARWLCEHMLNQFDSGAHC